VNPEFENQYLMMAQTSSSNPNSLPGIVTDQPEIFESEPASSIDTGVNDLDLASEPTDEAIALIEVPIKQAFSYFAERENEIAKFYVQRHGEYKISGGKPEEETDVEKYHRLVSEVNQLLNKFQTNKVEEKDDGMTISNVALTKNLEILSKQLKALEFAAKDGSLDPTMSGFLNIKSKLNELKGRFSSDDDAIVRSSTTTVNDNTSRLIRMSALERRLNLLESNLGNNDDKMQTLLKTTRCENLTDAVNTLGSWLSLFKADTLQRVNNELDFLSQRFEKMKGQASNDDETKQLDPQSRTRLDRLYDLVTSTDKHRALVPTVIHRLNAMEELQQKTAQVNTTVHHLEQTQAQIVESLQSNKFELASLTEMFAKNIDLIKEYSKDIDSRITAIRERDQ
jgi:hypothetical protein